MTRVPAGRPLAVVVAVAAILVSAARPAPAQTVTTDQADYPPGTTVVVTGSGWVAGELVSMVLTEYPPVDPPLVLAATADASGEFVNTQFTTQPDDIGIEFTLTATGQVSGAVAGTTFL